jgi:DNA-binding IclR family transcriptional regulator
MATSSEPGRSTANRLFALLYVFEHGPATMTLTELSEAASIPIATTYRIVQELLAAGALERNADGTYQVGMRLWELGSRAPRQRSLRQVARPLLESLHEATSETVQLVVLDGHRAVCVEKISGSRSAINVTEIAGRLPLHATGVGKVILAFTPEERARIATRPLRRFTPHTIVDQTVLDAELLRMQQDYVAYCHEEMTIGTASVAAPVFDSGGQFVAAIGVLTGSPAALQRLAPAVRTAALTVSQRLGHRPTDWPMTSHG